MNYKENKIIARDKITGFKGMVIGHADYSTGCDQYLLAPPVDEKGNWVESRWFDEGRLEIVEEEKPINVKAEKNGCDIPAPTK